MFHGKKLLISVVQDRSKIQTFPPTVFKMSTAEKSVQTQDSTTAPVSHFHLENAAAEVANTLVSMATGRQRLATNSTPPSLPILSLADYTTAHGVPTAMALANQAKISPVKPQEKSTKRSSKSKSARQQAADAIQYGPLLVKPRKSLAPTLANGRRSKDQPLPPDEDHKRRQRRDRNKEAAAKCRRKRNDLREQLEKLEKILLDDQKTLERNVQTLIDQKNQLEVLLNRHGCTKKARLPLGTSSTSLLDSNNNGNSKRVTINFANAQDLFAMGSLTRGSSTMSHTTNSDGVPMITIHIVPEVAQALLGSTSMDRAKLAELLQQASAAGTSST